MDVLLDTHVWVWHATASKRLPDKLRRKLDRASALWLSPVSAWELGLLVRGGRLHLSMDVDAWVRESQAGLSLREAALTIDIALASSRLALSHKDPADHLIAATALEYGLHLATVDQRLIDTDWLATIP
jgi:PIN domain nuclease of toxin-antitoxin system